MSIVKEITESRERCAEAGWYAYDLILNEPLSDEIIMNLRELGGSFIYLRQLKKPFFKLESDHFIIKGVAGDDYIRVAVHNDYREIINTVKEHLEAQR